ncbi:uncharacterized protein V1513DRAFT_474737 [Lipomyces chichibuensis]|uniref:uncharacterized protein n=1 Tax=Lipomyces chichibuensis TaxID=1546026 RepID=UPI0033434480
MARADEHTPYQRALKFLIDNEPEKRLDIQLSYQNFIALEEQAPLHSQSAVNLEIAIRDSILKVLVQQNKEELIDYIVAVGESTQESVNDQGTGSTKTPDGGLLFYNNKRSALTLIIKAGVSEGYRALKRDIELWLNEFRCPTCILFWLNENPRFRNPLRADKYPVTEHSAFDEAMQQAGNNHPFGPYSYRDHCWFGPLTKAFIEVFKRDASTGDIESTEHMLIENGTMVVDGDHLNLGLNLGDFFPDVPEIDSIRGVPIEITTKFVRQFVVSAAQRTAEARFNRFVRTSKRTLRPRPTAGR